MINTAATVDEWIRARSESDCLTHFPPHRLTEFAREMSPHITGWVTAPVFSLDGETSIPCFSRIGTLAQVREFIMSCQTTWIYDICQPDVRFLDCSPEERVIIRGHWTPDDVGT